MEKKPKVGLKSVGWREESRVTLKGKLENEEKLFLEPKSFFFLSSFLTAAQSARQTKIMKRFLIFKKIVAKQRRNQCSHLAIGCDVLFYGFDRVLLGFNGCYSITSGVTGFRRVLMSYIRYNWVFTEF